MSQVTTTYSFDAPTDFINFLSSDAEQETENVDSWFDEKANLENRFLGRNGIGEPFQGKASLRTATLQQGSGTPLKAVENTYYKETEKENLQNQSIPSNDCSSLNAKGTVSGNTPVQPQRRSVRLSAQKELEQKEKTHVGLVEMKAKRCATSDGDGLPNKRMKVAHKKKPEEEEEGSVPATSRKGEGEGLEKAKGRHAVSAAPPARQKVLKSTEEQELEKRLKMQQEVVEMRKKNEEFKKLSLAGPGHLSLNYEGFLE